MGNAAHHEIFPVPFCLMFMKIPSADGEHFPEIVFCPQAKQKFVNLLRSHTVGAIGSSHARCVIKGLEHPQNY